MTNMLEHHNQNIILNVHSYRVGEDLIRFAKCPFFISFVLPCKIESPVT
jgi:hypothetical protein